MTAKMAAGLAMNSMKSRAVSAGGIARQATTKLAHRRFTDEDDDEDEGATSCSCFPFFSRKVSEVGGRERRGHEGSRGEGGVELAFCASVVLGGWASASAGGGGGGYMCVCLCVCVTERDREPPAPSISCWVVGYESRPVQFVPM